MNAHDLGQLQAEHQTSPGPLAAERKAEIYTLLQGELRRRVRRRRTTRAVAATAALALLAAATAIFLRPAAPIAHPAPPIAAHPGPDTAPEIPTPPSPPSPLPPSTIAQSPAAPPSLPSPLRVAVIHTDPAIADRLAILPTGRTTVRTIGDDELLAALDEAGGERFGLVRAGRRLAVVCQTCIGGDAGPEWMQELRREWTGLPRRGG